MDPIIAGGLIAAGGSLLGGLMGQDSAEAARENNRIIADQNAATQREFAKHGVRWKVEDAAAAGIHPLAALGAQTHSFSPSQIGESADMSMANAMSGMGQDVGRAVAATQTEPEKQYKALQLQSIAADLEGKKIHNAMALKQLNNLSSSPSFPGGTNFMPGQGNSGLVRVNPSERTASQPGAPHQEAGWKPDLAYGRTESGLTPVIPKDLSESYESDPIGGLAWGIRNRLMPTQPPDSMLPKGASHWIYNGYEWQPRTWRSDAPSASSNSRPRMQWKGGK